MSTFFCKGKNSWCNIKKDIKIRYLSSAKNVLGRKWLYTKKAHMVKNSVGQYLRIIKCVYEHKVVILSMLSGFHPSDYTLPPSVTNSTNSSISSTVASLSTTADNAVQYSFNCKEDFSFADVQIWFYFIAIVSLAAMFLIGFLLGYCFKARRTTKNVSELESTTVCCSCTRNCRQYHKHYPERKKPVETNDEYSLEPKKYDEPKTQNGNNNTTASTEGDEEQQTLLKQRHHSVPTDVSYADSEPVYQHIQGVYTKIHK